MTEEIQEIINSGGADIDTESLSELLELESRRYSRRLGEEDEARLR